MFGRSRLSSTARGYGPEHRARRAALLPHYLGTRCQVGGPRCDGVMTVPARMHLDHTTPLVLGGREGDRIICAPCNVWLGARLGAKMRAARRGRRRPSRVW